MFRSAKPIGLAAAVGLAVLGVIQSPAHGQVRFARAPRLPQFQGPANAGNPIIGLSPFFRVAPGLSLAQAAFNTTVMGGAFQNFPAYALPYASPYALGYSPFNNPGVPPPGFPWSYLPNNPFIYPYVFGNPYGGATMSSAGYGGGSPGFPGGGYGGGQNGAYSNPYGSYYGPYQGYLSGAADVIRGQSNYMVSAQQANLVKEQVQRERVENRRRVLDEWLYEREKTPTAEDDRARTRKLEEHRARNDPPATETYAGKSLNDLLDHLKKLPANALP